MEKYLAYNGDDNMLARIRLAEIQIKTFKTCSLAADRPHD
jgi:hypothetical protein